MLHLLYVTQETKATKIPPWYSSPNPAIIIIMDTNEVRDKMAKTVEVVSQEISTIRTGRATTSMIENVPVAAYGGAQTLRVMELASITVEDAQTMVVKPWDASVIGEIAKSLSNTGMGLSANIDGEIIRVKVPELTEERRKEFVKLLHTKMENGKVSLRQIRHDAMKDISKAEDAKDISEDERHDLEKEVQEITDKHVTKIDEIGKAKEADLMQV